MGTGVDNIEIDRETGDLWIGCHPLAYAILDFFDFFGYAHPSQVPTHEYDMGTQVDNIEVDPDTGDLWIGCHPLSYAFMDFLDLFRYAHPSQGS